MGGLRKSKMDSDSRKAQRNSFAHHRAERLDVTRGSFADDMVGWFAKPDSVGARERDHFFTWRLPIVSAGAALTL
jgi:hypothetical protein